MAQIHADTSDHRSVEGRRHEKIDLVRAAVWSTIFAMVIVTWVTIVWVVAVLLLRIS
jgi:hypothetical protein